MHRSFLLAALFSTASLSLHAQWEAGGILAITNHFNASAFHQVDTGLFVYGANNPGPSPSATEGGILRTIEAILPVAQASGDMKVLRRINADEAVKVIAEANNVPAKALRTDEELEEMDMADQQQAQMQQLLAAAPLAGQAAERFAKAEQIAASAPRREVL
jgi:hypothetical protein